MRLYLAGPMRGIPAYNFPAFAAAAADLRARGHEVWNPAENDVATDGFDPERDTPQPMRHYMARDLPAVLASDAVAVLPGWRNSTGARMEVYVADGCGIPVLDAATLEPVAETILEEAQRLVHGNRGADYGHPADDFMRTGRLWGAILGIGDIDPRLCALMMAAMKISREVNKPKRDNRVDLAGYAECADMIAARQENG